MGIVKFKSSNHWYNADGSPQHDADLRVARKQNLYPSITTLDKQEFVNEFLEKWKMEEAIMAATFNPRQPHESPEQYAQRIYELSLEKAITAADFGTKIHDAIEKYPATPEDPEILPYFQKYAIWHEENVAEVVCSEKVVVDHELGLAGRLDRILILKTRGRAVVDYKTQGVKKDDKGRLRPNFYDSWIRQLAFYAVCDAKETKTFPTGLPVAMSLVIPSNEPEVPIVRIWEKDELIEGYQQVCVAAWRFFTRKKFYPHKYGMFKLGFNIPLPE